MPPFRFSPGNHRRISPAVMNEKGALYAILAIAKKLNVTFMLATLKVAKVIKE